MAATVADTIRELTRVHLEENKGMLLGQCITAVGWIQNTVPSGCRGYMELPMNDCSGPGIAIGASIAGERPIFILRFQSFLWLAANYFVNHAAKSKELFGYPAPVFVRAIATEGELGGPVHTNCFHNLFMNPPGMPVFAPMTPKEYEWVWDFYLKNDDPVLVSEHRTSYTSSVELEDRQVEGAEITLYGISAARFRLEEAADRLKEQGIRANISHIFKLKPSNVDSTLAAPLEQSGAGLMVESGYETCSAAEHFASQLMYETGRPVKVLGQFDRTSGVAKRLDNGTPSVERIVENAKQVIQRKKEKRWT